MNNIPANLLKHLKEECPNISDEICNTLCNLDNTNNNKTNKTKNKNNVPMLKLLIQVTVIIN